MQRSRIVCEAANSARAIAEAPLRIPVLSSLSGCRRRLAAQCRYMARTGFTSEIVRFTSEIVRFVFEASLQQIDRTCCEHAESPS